MSGPSVNILDATLREGELNSGVYYSADMLETVGFALAELGTPRIEFSIAYPQRGGSIQVLKNILNNIQSSYDDITTIVQCRAFKHDIEIAQKTDAKGCGVYIAISEEHRKHKLSGMKVEDVLSRFVESLDLLKDHGFKYRRAVLEDSARFFSEYKGEEDTLENLENIIKCVDEAGATTISLPDSAGLLEESRALEMMDYARKITDKELAAHFHNDYGNALGNTKAVIKNGLVKEAHVSIYGLGAGAGIADHYEVSANIIDNLKIETGEDRGYFKQLYKKFQEVTKIPIPWNHPLSDFARTEKAGTHQAQQLKSPEGYVPPRKLKHDFNSTILFEAGQFMSRHLVDRLLEGHDVDDAKVREIASLIGRRATLLNRKLYSREIKNVIKEVANIDVPSTRISQYIGPEKAFYLIKVRPQVTTEINEKIERLEGVERALEIFGIYDIIVEARADEDLQRKIEKLFGPHITEISPLIVG